MKKELLFYIPSEHDETGVAGPYDLVQLAAMLRRRQISAETPVFQEADAEWKPFADRPQFIVAREMPADAVSHRQISLDEEASAGESMIPLPSKEQLVQLAMAVILLLVGAVIAYGVARIDAAAGICLFILASSVAAIAMLLIIFKMLDEDWMTMLLLGVVPLYDLYYLMANIDRYFTLLAFKYGGTALALAAYAGLASVASHQSDDVKSVLHMIGL